MTPKRLGRYEILDRIGIGGMGEVYRARDSELGRIVAVKVLRDLGAAKDDQRARFRREARSAAALNHPNVATIYDFGEEPGDDEAGAVLFLAMELVDGESLTRGLGADPDPAEVAKVAIRIARGLQAAHTAGLVHRDLKSSNILITRGEVGELSGVKILDFGLAKAFAETDALAGLSTDMSLTQEGKVVGTPHYMAPELFKGVAADPRSDLYSFGVVLYRLLARRFPFPGDSLMEVLENLAAEEPPPLAEIRPDVSPELARIVHKLLDKARDRRYAEAREVEADLVALVGTPGQFTPLESPTQVVPTDHEGISTDRATAATRSPRVAQAAAAAAAVVVVALALWGWLRPGAGPSSSPQRLAVLAFANLTGDPGLQYLSPGLSSALIGQLAGLPELEVLSASFARAYQDSDSALRDLANEDRLDRVVEGQLLGTREELQVLVSLTNARDGSVIWSSTFDGAAEELLVLQARIAGELGGRLALSDSSLARLTQPPTVSEAALRGTMEAFRYLEDTSSPIGLTTAAHLFERAVEADGEFALAQYGLSEALVQLSQRQGEPALLDRAEKAARTALRLEPESHLPRLALARVYRVRGDAAAALQELEDALVLQPNSPDLFKEFVVSYEQGGDPEAAESNLTRLAELLDPATVYRHLGRHYESEGELDRAESYFRRALGSEPGDWRNWNGLGVFLLQGRMDLEEASTSLERAMRLAPAEDIPRDNLASVLLYRSDFAGAVELMEDREGPVADAVVASNLGTAYFYLDDLSRAEGAYLRAIALESENYIFHANLGDLYVRRGDAELAEASFADSLATLDAQLGTFPDRHDLRAARAMMLAKVGDCEGAAALADELVAGARVVEELIRLGKSNAVCGRIEATLEVVRRLEEYGFDTSFLRQEDEYRSLLGEPRFLELTEP